jgi:hypothetical protein
MLASLIKILYTRYHWNTIGGVVAQKKKRVKFLIILLIFIVYFLVAARPIPRETVLTFRWITSLPTASSQEINVHPEDEHSEPTFLEPGISAVSGQLIPFTLGSRFGYIDSSGLFAMNRTMINHIYLSQNMWTEYDVIPVNITINNILTGNEINIENPGGYPVLLDDRVFILGSEQNSLSEIDHNGNVKWTYEFGAPLTCIDVAAGLVVTGSLDGAIEVFNSDGERLFYFEPGGSRYSVILGVAISRNGSRIAVVCGIEQQRFLLLERFGNTGGEYRVIHHEFLETGFRRPVRVLFIDDDRRIVFEREGGIGCYNIRSRRSIFIPLDGEIAAIDESGDKGHFFIITSQSYLQKNIIGIRFPSDRLFGASGTSALDSIFMRAPFKSNNVFLTRTYGSRDFGYDSRLVIGGGTAIISFALEER